MTAAASGGSSISERKDDHVRLASEQHRGVEARNDFDEVQFVHHALAGIDREAVSLRTSFASLSWPVPLYINGMTGGSEKTGEVNRQLAIAAAATGVPIASGSTSAMLKDPSLAPSFTVLREENPHGFVMANVNAETAPDDAARVVEAMQADALQVHINAVQETVMPEGSRTFSRWPSAIAAIVERVEVPVIVKEVGFGLSPRTLKTLASLGVTVADVAGRGGTDFASIENARRESGDFAMLSGFGQSTVTALLDARAAGIERPALLASGGVRHPLDGLRALALGAHAIGIAGAALHVVQRDGAEGLITYLRGWLDRLAELMALLGAADVTQLSHTELLLRGSVREFCELRGIDATAYARRGDVPIGRAHEHEAPRARAAAGRKEQ